MLIHEFFLCDGEGTEFITKRIFILSRRKLFQEGVIPAATIKVHSTDHDPQILNVHFENRKFSTT